MNLMFIFEFGLLRRHWVKNSSISVSVNSKLFCFGAESNNLLGILLSSRDIENSQEHVFCTTVFYFVLFCLILFLLFCRHMFSLQLCTQPKKYPVVQLGIDSPELHLSTFLAGISKDINIMRGLFIRKYEGIDTCGRS